MLIAAHNLTAMNAGRQYGVVTKNRAKTAEKLSSGYDINRAADNAAGLAISEKMRRLIRGLDQGTRNAEDGVSWTQIGDGALNEAHDILHRMTELSIQSLNETNSEKDRSYLQSEFEHLQTELDRISKTTKFNELNIFEEHKPTYYQCEGDVKWNPEQLHEVKDGRNDLIVKYRKDDKAPQEKVTIKVPAGNYTTQELADAIDSALENEGALADGIMFEMNGDGYCNVNFEGGEVIDTVAGSLSYLLYDMYEGGEFGALIGTTSFVEGMPLEITSENNTLTFTIQDFNGNETQKTVQIPVGWYTKQNIIDILNDELKDTTVKATEHGSGIKLGSEDSIVTKFKGNMFKIDAGYQSNSSVFYDNVSYGQITLDPASFKGGYVLNSNIKDEEYNVFRINSSNNQLTIQTNGMDAPVTLTIPDGEYKIDGMRDTLNNLFVDNSLKLVATYGTQVSDGQTFYGITITSQTEGLDSKIDIDSSSSAYNTLFVDRKYTYYYGGSGYQAEVTHENSTNEIASFTGSKELNDLSVTPLNVTAGTNDKFMINIDGTSYDITMSPGQYNSVTSLVDEINLQLNNGKAANPTLGNIEAVVSDSGLSVALKMKPGGNIINLTASAYTAGGVTNGGYDEIFQGYNVSYTTHNVTGTGSIILDKPYDGTVEPSDNPLKITVNNTEYTVNLREGNNVSKDEIIEAINNTIPGHTDVRPNSFNTVNGYGNTDVKTVTGTGSGNTSFVSWNDSNVGETGKLEGTTGAAVNKAATISTKNKLPDVINITDSTNNIKLTINNVTKDITLASKSYTPEQFKTALQQAINTEFGTGYGGATVDLVDGKIVLTARMDENHPGITTSMAWKTDNSSLLKEISTTRTTAKMETSMPLSDNIQIEAGVTDTFKFTLRENGTTSNVTLTLAEGNYSRSSLATELNKQLSLQNINVTASVNRDGDLVLETKAVGNGNSITYNSSTGGTSSKVIFGNLVTLKKADKLIPINTLDTIVLDDTTNNNFSITVNNQDYTVMLDKGTYDRDTLVTELNDKLNSIGIEAYKSGSKIGFRSLVGGSQQTFSINYDENSALKAIYGETVTKYPGVTASFENDNLKLTSDPGVKLSLSSDTGGGFITSQKNVETLKNTIVKGYTSTKHGTIDGYNISQPIEIDEYNNNLSFTYEDNGVSRDISIEIDEYKKYTYDELQQKLTELLDAAAGPGELTVSVNANGVVIKTVGVGPDNRLSNPKGDFYEKIMCYSREMDYNQSNAIVDKDGKQKVTGAYTIGRQDVVSGTTKIRAGVSDELKLDFTVNNTLYTLEMKLDPGEYTGSQLQQHIQEKLNEQLVDQGFSSGFIEVGLGDILTNVVGANDDKALNFRVADDIPAKEEGDYIIDGVGGNAAFAVFYSTDGELIPAYVEGSKDVTNGVRLKNNEHDLSFTVDGVTYDIELGASYYPADSLVETMNKKLEDAGAPLVATVEDGKVKISHTSLGRHSIEISGSARDEIFFREHGAQEKDKGVRIQLSSEVEDFLDIPRSEYSTTLLGINTICISKVDNASKALDRVSKAVDIVSQLRSKFGSTQNRLEHAIASNENKSENTQASESRIRDADMSERMMELAKYNILQQAGEAMMAQSNKSNQGILSLLQ